MSAAEPVQEFFSIGEVCELTDLKPHVLRYWESQFRFLSPAKNRSGASVADSPFRSQHSHTGSAFDEDCIPSEQRVIFFDPLLKPDEKDLDGVKERKAFSLVFTDQ